MAGIARFIDNGSSFVTLEGDSTVMYLQTARSLLKSARKSIQQKKKLNKNLDYISELPFVMTSPSDYFCKAEK